MKTAWKWTIVIWCCISCTGLKEIPLPDDDSEENVWTGPGANVDGGLSQAICYITGIDYPKGWDWTDAAEDEESVRCSLVVFADGVPMLKLPVGDGHEVSADPDMHKVIDGHLYTIFCSDGQTSVRKNGKSFLKYDGEETIREMVSDEEDLHTLGVPRDGRGFTYRKNGELIMERSTGYAFERLHIDSGKMCFAFCQNVTTSDGTLERYYMVRDGRLSLVEFDEDVTMVWDMISHQGKTCSLVSSGPWNTAELLIDDESAAIGMPYGAEMLSCRLFVSGDRICIEGLYSDEDGNLCSGLWVEGQEYMLFETGQSIAASCSSESDICCVLNPDSENPAGLIFKSGRTWPMPEDYHLRGNSPLTVHEGNLYIGLTSLSGSAPLVWMNGTTSTIKINGPLCTLSIGTSREDAGT